MNISKKLLVAVLACLVVSSSDSAYGMKRMRDWTDWLWERTCKRPRLDEVIEHNHDQVPVVDLPYAEEPAQQEQQLVPYVPQSNFEYLPAEINQHILAVLVDLGAFDNFTNASDVSAFIQFMRLRLRLTLPQTVKVLQGILAARNIDLSKPIGSQHWNGTVLYAACLLGDRDSCRVICSLVRGPKFWEMITSPHSFFKTTSVFEGNFECFEILHMAAGGDVLRLLEMRNVNGSTALMRYIKCVKGDENTNKLFKLVGDKLYEHMIDRDNDGNTLLHYAATNYFSSKCIFDLPGDRIIPLLFVTNAAGETPLYYAVKADIFGQGDQILKKAGKYAKVLILVPTHAGKTAYDCACEMAQKDPSFEWRKNLLEKYLTAH